VYTPITIARLDTSAYQGREEGVYKIKAASPSLIISLYYKHKTLKHDDTLTYDY
jgi:hypothetical protein